MRSLPHPVKSSSDSSLGGAHVRRRATGARPSGRRQAYRRILLSIVVVTTLLLAACGPRVEYRVSELVLERQSWDTLHVDVSFVRETAIGGATIFEPDTVMVMLFDENYDSLYTGAPGPVPVPDRRLGDGERLTIEACGSVISRRICIQDLLRASPKRIEVEGEIEYPLGSELTTGRYALAFDVERQLFESDHSDQWQPINEVDISGYLRAWVENTEARQEGAVEVPFDQPHGSFDLSRRPNYRDFRYYLDSQLLDQDTAFVSFDVFAGLGGQATRLTSIRKEVFWKTDDEREEDVRYFAREGAERVVDELGSFLGGRRAVAYVDDWRYNTQQRIYRLDLEVRWEGSLFDRGRYALEGFLEVREDGRSASFEVTDANRRAERRWRRRVDGNVLQLGDLGSPARVSEREEATGEEG